MGTSHNRHPLSHFWQVDSDDNDDSYVDKIDDSNVDRNDENDESNLDSDDDHDDGNVEGGDIRNENKNNRQVEIIKYSFFILFKLR